MNQKGFATLEVILMVVVIGILATIAVPRFERITAQTNTAKVVSDLAAINSAAAVYQMEKNDKPTYANLENYLENGLPKAPSGKIFIEGKLEEIGSSDSYGIDSSGHAIFGGKTADKFTSSTSGSSSGSGTGTGGNG
ncbi:MAG: hypothetical protein J5809_04135 [Selenomonadaceae bacterium]|nr:hypothetical protein [Selenomonadaceae bacterium]